MLSTVTRDPGSTLDPRDERTRVSLRIYAGMSDEALVAATDAMLDWSERWYKDWHLRVLRRAGAVFGNTGWAIDNGSQSLIEIKRKNAKRASINLNILYECVETAVAAFGKADLYPRALPASGSEPDLRMASAANQVLAAAGHGIDIAGLLREAYWWLEVAGTAHLGVFWDPYAEDWVPAPPPQDGMGNPLPPLAGPDGQPLPFPTRTERKRVGALRGEVTNPLETFACPAVKRKQDVPWLMLAPVLSAEDAEARYPDQAPFIKFDRAPTISPILQQFEALTNGSWSGGSSDPRAWAVRVKCVWHRPTRAFPRGAYWCVAGGRMVYRHTITDPETGQMTDALPYDHSRLPFATMSWTRVNWSKPHPPLENARVPQRMLDRREGQIDDHLEHFAEPIALMGPTTRLESAEYVGNGYREVRMAGGYGGEKTMPPTFVQPPPLNQALFFSADRYEKKARGQMNVTAILQGLSEPGVETADEVNTLMQNAAMRFNPTVEEIKAFVADAGYLLLTTARQYWRGPRAGIVTDEEGKPALAVVEASGLPAEHRVVCEARSGLAESPESRKRDAKEAFQALAPQLPPGPVLISALEWYLRESGNVEGMKFMPKLHLAMAQTMAMQAGPGMQQQGQEAQQHAAEMAARLHQTQTDAERRSADLDVRARNAEAEHTLEAARIGVEAEKAHAASRRIAPRGGRG